MKLKRFFTLALLVVAVVISVAAEGAPHRDKRDRRPPPDGMRPQISEETRKLAAACRREPNEENRAALKKQIGVDYDRFLEELRAKLRGNKHDRKNQELRRRLEAMTRDREKRIEEIMRRVLNQQERPDERPPKGPKHRRRD